MRERGWAISALRPTKPGVRRLDRASCRQRTTEREIRSDLVLLPIPQRSRVQPN